MATGIVKWFGTNGKSFGLITPDVAGRDLFVHYSGIAGDGGFKELHEGQAVEFDVIESPKGSQAVNVVVVKA